MSIQSSPVLSAAARSSYGISAGTLIRLGDLTAQQKSDILNSLLFAQLAADAKHPNTDSFEAAAEWYKEYLGVLGKVGYTVQASEFTEVMYKAQQTVVADAVLAILQDDKKVDKDTFGSISRAILALALSGPGSAAESVFDKASITSSNFAGFRIATASAEQGQLSLTCCSLYYGLDREVKTALWDSFDNNSLKFHKVIQAMVLNENVYASVREAINTKLEAKAHLLQEI